MNGEMEPRSAETEPHTNHAQITLEKIRAEWTKIARETDKLEEEIKQLRRPETPPWKTITWWRDLLGVFSVVATLFYGVHNFLMQQKERTEFTVTKEVITLAQQLTGDPQQQGNAAILLSAYGGHAVPVLLNTLAGRMSPGLLTALELIATQEPKAVVPQLRQRVETHIDGVMAGDVRLVQLFKHYLKALGVVAKFDDVHATAGLLRKARKTFDCAHVQAAGDFKLSLVERRAVCAEIANACTHSGACP